MKKVLLFFGLCFFVVLSNAQFSVTAEHLTLSETELSDDMHVAFDITNTASTDLEITWVRDLTEFPANWSTYICDPTNCYLPWTEMATFTLAKDATGEVSIHIDPKTIVGTGSLDVEVSDQNGNKKTIKVDLDLGEVVATALSLEHNPVDIVEPDVTTYEVIAETKVTNTGTGDLNTVWTLTDVVKESGWVMYVCDTYECYPPNKLTGDFTLKADETGPFSVHVLPNEIMGHGSGTIELVESEDVKQTAIFTFEIGITANGDIEEKSLVIYPNPTTGVFNVVSENTEIGQVDIFNILGKNVQTVTRDFNTIDISNQVRGIYLVQLKNINNDIISTIRMNKL